MILLIFLVAWAKGVRYQARLNSTVWMVITFREVLCYCIFQHKHMTKLNKPSRPQSSLDTLGLRRSQLCNNGANFQIIGWVIRFFSMTFVPDLNLFVCRASKWGVQAMHEHASSQTTWSRRPTRNANQHNSPSLSYPLSHVTIHLINNLYFLSDLLFWIMGLLGKREYRSK